VTNITRNGVCQIKNEGLAFQLAAASMSYYGTVPPTYLNGDLLINGYYTSNIPVRSVQDMNAEVIFVVDIGKHK
jgi:predicted acylesterase/phospholipase RssA